MKLNFLHLALLMISLVGVSNHSFAASSTQQGTMTATVSNTCTVPSGATLSFGSFNPLTQTSNVDVDISFTIQCTTGAVITDIDLGNSLNTNSTTARKMKRDGSSTTCSASQADPECLSYILYIDSSRQVNWGSITSSNFSNYYSSSKRTGLGFGPSSALTFTVYGRIPTASSNITNLTKAGTYSDSLTITINY